MTRQDAVALAHRLMTEHLTHKGHLGWRFSINNDKSRLGVCRFNEKSIELSTWHIEHSTDAEVLDTILHEIAHARVGPKHGHDMMWRLVAKALGANGERCGKTGPAFKAARLAKAAYIGTCAACNVEIPRFKLTKAIRNNSTMYHTVCGRAGAITWRPAGSPVPAPLPNPTAILLPASSVMDPKRAAAIERSRQWHIRNKAQKMAAQHV